MNHLLHTSPAVLTAALLGCASRVAPSAPVAEAPSIERVDPGPSSYESEIGGMNEEAVSLAFASLQPGVIGCVERASERVAPIGGHLTIRLRIDRQGAAKWAYLAASTIGDRATEKCVLDLARGKTWPRPVGGEGVAESSFDIDARTAPVTWTDDHVRPAIASVRSATTACRRGIQGGFAATVYVRANGHVLAAGVAPPSEAGEGAADCVVEAIHRLRFRAPGAKTAKVSFEIR